MGKKKFGGEKLDVKGVLNEPAAPKQVSGPAWSQGAGAARVAPPASSSLASPPKTAAKAKGPSLGGSWAKGGPQGLAATATSLNAQFAPAARSKPVPHATVASSKPALGLKRASGAPAPSLDSDAFAPLEKPKDAKEIAEEKAQAAIASSFPEVAAYDAALVALCNAAGSVSGASVHTKVDDALRWLLRSGIPDAPTTESRDRILFAGGLIVAELTPRGDHAGQITSILEGYFAEQQSKGKNSPQILEANGLVDAVLFGKLALHLEDCNPKVSSIRLRLLRRMIKPTTSKVVQRALADALFPLIAKEEQAAAEATESNSPAQTVSDMCLGLFSDPSETVRTGAALGAAAAARACGAGHLRKKINDEVEAAIKAEGKTSSGRRQAGLLCFAELAAGLGRAFEPYALKSLPMLLNSCADDKKEVYMAGRCAAQAVVAHVSVNCLKMMVKPVLEGIRDKRWKTQISAIELLKTIVVELAENAPKRMAMVLPQVVPALCEAAASARGEVRDNVRAVLEKVGSSITHQDVASLSPQLIAALADPSEGPIAKALDSLLAAVYTTAIDGPACALICPVIERALTRGDAAAQQKGAVFARGLVLHAGESEELTPYFTQLRAPLEALLSHPSPGVRESAAQAIGSLAAAPTQDEGVDSSSKLLAKLDQPQDGAEMEGTAQGIAATLGSVSEERRQELLSELSRDDVATQGRLCRLCVCAHLPKSMARSDDGGNAVATMLPVLVRALCDSDEAVRTIARRAFDAASEAAKDQTAAADVSCNIERALRAEDPRARVAAAELAIGFMPNRALQANKDARASLVTAVVIAQADSDTLVRRVADRAWRTATEGGGAPGKQLKELRPHLLTRIIEDMQCGQVTHAKAAGRAAGQLHERLESSGGLLDDLAPGILDALLSSDPTMQVSVCGGFSEILRVAKCSRHLMGSDQLSDALRSVLLSDTSEVRVAAAACAATAPVAFVTEPFAKDLCEAATDVAAERNRALEEIVRADGSGDALKAIIENASSSPYCNSKLGCLAAAASAPPQLLRQVAAEVAVACVEAGAGDLDSAGVVAKVWTSRLDADGVRDFVAATLSRVDKGSGDRHSEAAACVIAEVLGLSAVLPADCEELLDALIPGAFVAEDRCASAFAESLLALARIVGSGSLAEGATPRIFALLSQDRKSGRIATRTFEALAPILQQGVVGIPEQRRAAVDSLALMFKGVDAHTLQGQAVKCAGPLVRALGEKSAEQELHNAVLLAIGVLLEGAGDALRPLVPALLTALVKALDGPEEMKQAAASALAALAATAPKIEVVVKALGKPPQKAAHLEALATVLEALPTSRLLDAKPAVQAILEAAGKVGDKEVTSGAAKVAAALKV
eukprot:TRINITY_DN62306_c0_g1_i1.p1 TRINITY_DN62306_c0_g1~~TRINITY_DN62306_c0_g1_i1.p1  ORF type:complete len:1363 (-),score=279.25 TRINITY_DN62306_c0_g1_i1:108-4196(-)